MTWALWVVSLPRSLSSCLMRMSKEAGLDPYCDDQTQQPGHWHAANPYGFYEKLGGYARPVETFGGVDGAGRSAKVFAKNVPVLLAAGIAPDRAVLLRRPIEEIFASWDAHFPPLKRTPAEMVANLDRAHAALLAADIPVHVEQSHDVIDHPIQACARIAEFLQSDGEAPERMAACVDPTLRHFDSR